MSLKVCYLSAQRNFTHPTKPRVASKSLTPLGPRNGSGTLAITLSHNHEFVGAHGGFYFHVHVWNATDPSDTLFSMNGVWVNEFEWNGTVRSPCGLRWASISNGAQSAKMSQVVVCLDSLTSSAGTGWSKLFSFLTATFIKEKNACDAAIKSIPVLFWMISLVPKWSLRSGPGIFTLREKLELGNLRAEEFGLGRSSSSSGSSW